MPLSNPSTPANTDGWIDHTTRTWVYASASTFTIAGVDLTSVFTKGTRLKWTQTTVKYGVVVSSSFSTDTTVTIAVNNDYTIANAAISANYYSYAVNPQGYPTWFNFTPTYTGFSSDPSLGGGQIRFAVIGSMCCYEHTPFSGGTSNATTFTITLPIASLYLITGQLCRALNNGAFPTAPGMLSTAAASSTLTVALNTSGAAWTNSGGKNAQFLMWYEI